MSNPLETIKSLVGLTQPTTNTISPTASSSSPLTIEPVSHPIEGDKQKTELQSSAPAVVPAKLGVTEIEPTNDEIAIPADAEAGVSLNEVVPVRSGS
jgi:hypothetical protein